MRRFILLVLLSLVLPAVADSYALRELDPIRGPGQDQAPAAHLPVPREQVEAFVLELAAAWRSRELEAFLAKDFPDRERLLDELALRLPVDARLRVLSIGTIQTLSQRSVPDGRISEVLVRLNAQVEFADREGRLQLLPTSQEWVVRIAQRLP